MLNAHAFAMSALRCQVRDARVATSLATQLMRILAALSSRDNAINWSGRSTPSSYWILSQAAAAVYLICEGLLGRVASIFKGCRVRVGLSGFRKVPFVPLWCRRPATDQVRLWGRWRRIRFGGPRRAAAQGRRSEIGGALCAAADGDRWSAGGSGRRPKVICGQW